MKNHLFGITELRAFAALWVVILHAYFSIESLELPKNLILKNFIQRGWLGVDLFLILSGFVILHVTHTRKELGEAFSVIVFWFRRFARIYPVHLATLVLFILTYLGASHLGENLESKGWTPLNFFSQLFLLHGVGPVEPKGWNWISWSVSSECLAYLCFPILYLLVQRVNTIRTSLFFIASILLISIMAAMFLNHSEKFMLGYEFVSWRAISEFTMGMFLYRIYQRTKVSAAYIFIFLLGIIGIVMQGLVVSSFYDFFYLIYFMMIILGVARSPINGEIRFLRFLGEISYSTYLVHILIITFISKVVSHLKVQLSPMFILLLVVLLVHVVAAILYKLIEVPAKKILLNTQVKQIKESKIELQTRQIAD